MLDQVHNFPPNPALFLEQSEYIYALALGTSLGDLHENIKISKIYLKNAGLHIFDESPIYGSAPAGGVAQNTFLNQVVAVKTSFNPEKTLELVLGVELKMGRRRQEKWEDRLIDIDILVGRHQKKAINVDTENLKIPHPYIKVRWFQYQLLNNLQKFQYNLMPKL